MLPVMIGVRSERTESDARPGTLPVPLRLKYLIRGPGTMARMVGLPAAMAASSALARAVFSLNPPSRARVEASLCRALGTSAADIEDIARRSFEHAGAFWVEALYCGRRLTPSGLARCVAVLEPRRWQKLAADPGPHLLVTSYFGNPAAGACALSEICPPVAVLVDPLARALIQCERHVLRRFRNLELIEIRDAARRVPRFLEAGGRLIVLAGRPVESGGVNSTFLGVTARRSAAVARLAHRHRAAIVAFVCRRLDRGAFQFALEWLGRVHNAPSEGALRRTQSYLDLLEQPVREHPEQFLWTIFPGD